MINRIREIRKQKGLTLTELAELCEPPTTPQTLGRLETGMRNLSLKWMDRIGTAMGVEPEILVRSDDPARPKIIAELNATGPEALSQPREAVLPSELATPDGELGFLVLEVNTTAGEYRTGDLVWLRQIPLENASASINRDCLVPRPGGRFAFGRLIDCKGSLVGILPAQTGTKQQVVDNPPWIAIAAMLVRSL